MGSLWAHKGTIGCIALIVRQILLLWYAANAQSQAGQSHTQTRCLATRLQTTFEGKPQHTCTIRFRKTFLAINTIFKCPLILSVCAQ